MQFTTGIFSDSFRPIMDGVGSVTKNYAYWLNRTLGPSYVIAPAFPGFEDDEEFEVLRFLSCPIPRRSPYRVPVIGLDVPFRLRLNQLKLDLVHVHSPLVMKIGIKIARKRDVPIVATLHSKYMVNLNEYIRMPAVAEGIRLHFIKYYAAVDEVWVPNRSTEKTIREYGYDRSVVVMPNGIDIQAPDDENALRSLADEDWGTGEKDRVMLYIGQHVWEKNLRMLIEALKLTADRDPDFRVIFVGEGYSRRDMESMVRELGLSEIVQFVGVVRDRERIRAYYSRADLFLFPSLYDTSPLTMREAAAFQVPTVMIEGATGAEGILDRENGFLAEGTPAGFAQKLIGLLKDPELVRTVGAGAFESFYQSWEDVLQGVRERYLRLLNQRVSA